MRISKEALFKGVSTRFGLQSIEKSVENHDFIFCSSFQNRRFVNHWAQSHCRVTACYDTVHLLFILSNDAHKVQTTELAQN
jgi:hypothetical protein